MWALIRSISSQYIHIQHVVLYQPSLTSTRIALGQAHTHIWYIFAMNGNIDWIIIRLLCGQFGYLASRIMKIDRFQTKNKIYPHWRTNWRVHLLPFDRLLITIYRKTEKSINNYLLASLIAMATTTPTYTATSSG